MKMINRFIREKFKNLKSHLSDVAKWLSGLTPVKLTAIAVVNCFLLTAVYGQAVAAVAENVRATQQFKQMFEDFTLPYSYGNIVDANYTGSDTVVITVQDLHSHPEVQKNISNIIGAFDKEYKVKNVYLEGAYGQVDTSWLKAVSDKDLRSKVLESMIESGRLTGTEYYSALSGRKDLIRGLENKEEYLNNLKRFGEILDYQNDSEPVIKSMEEDADAVKKIYFNKRQLKVDALSKEYEAGNIDAKKYFANLKGDTDKLGIDIYKYDNIRTYVQLLEDAAKIKYDRATRELHEFVGKLEGRLPYSLYQMLLDSTNNFTDLDKLYVYLIRLARENNLDLSVNFPELNKFFGYLELNQKVNSLEMMKEEQRLADEINEGFGTNASEQEAAFLAGFIRYMRDYYSSKITSDDYAYYKANIGKFKKLWVKYVDNKKLDMLEAYEKKADKFYEINIARNGYFIGNIDGLEEAGKEAEIDKSDKSASEKVIKSLRSAKNVYVLVAGGFHRQGISDLLAKKGISYIVITPNATSGLSAAEETYYNIVKEQSKILFQALAALNASQSGDRSQIALYMNALASLMGESNITSQEDWQALEGQIASVLGELKTEDSDAYGDIQEAGAKRSEDGTVHFTFRKGGKTFDIIYNGEAKGYNKVKIAIVAQEKLEAPMSVNARKPITVAAAAATAVSAVAIIASIACLTAAPFVFPLVLAVSFLWGGVSLSILGFSAYENKKLNEQIAKSAMA
ncbi:MAG: hypothetical protein FWC57_03580, partial [Endomicrobia bacterium]|nr:hypothetical protein [Endomicrobiia bacterium]